MGSRENVKKIKVSNDGVVFEGALGQLRKMGVVDGTLLEIEGTDARASPQHRYCTFHTCHTNWF